MSKQIPYTETHLPCRTLDVTYHDSITYKPVEHRRICCAIFKFNSDKTLDVYYTFDDWYRRKPNVTFENIIEMGGVCNG